MSDDSVLGGQIFGIDGRQSFCQVERSRRGSGAFVMGTGSGELVNDHGGVSVPFDARPRKVAAQPVRADDGAVVSRNADEERCGGSAHGGQTQHDSCQLQN